MPKFLIEVSHDDAITACRQAHDAIEGLGSHFVSQADWGCHDGVHKGWLIVEVDNRRIASLIVPPGLRQGCRIVKLNKWLREGIASTMAAGLVDGSLPVTRSKVSILGHGGS